MINDSTSPTSTPTPTPSTSWLQYMIKAERISAWILALAIIGFGITGFGMTKGFISRDIAQTLHFRFLGAVALIAFVIHTSWGAHLALKRNRLWNPITKIGLITVYTIIVGFFGFMHFFYQPSTSLKQVPIAKEQPASMQTSIETTSGTTAFTAETLKVYNGLNGQPAYVAIDGIVYDLSSVFRNGKHNGYEAGKELSEAFHGKHPQKYLEGKPIVGTYQE